MRSVPEHPATVADFAGLAREIAADRASWSPVVRY
ncbi:cysteine dioxygenase, partial [Streptomyces sp. NPDC048845]